tara:strand:- start:5404 stop:6309 length:906 start_codon:yes stop_codon:yes gene_type:complete
MKIIHRSILLCGIIIVSCVCTYGILSALSRPQTLHPFFQLETIQAETNIIANKGGSDLWPENTTFAFEQLAELGINAIRIDLRLSKDNRLVLIHDKTTDRTTNMKAIVNELNLDELENLDAGHHWTNDNITYTYRDIGITIPTFTEVLTNFPNFQKYINLNDNNTLASEILCMKINEHNAIHTVIVSSESSSIMQHFRNICPAIATEADPNETRTFLILNTMFLSPIYTPNFHLIEIPEYLLGFRVITPYLIRSAELKGIRVHAINNSKTDNIAYLLEHGIHGIITNTPLEVIDIIKKTQD